MVPELLRDIWLNDILHSLLFTLYSDFWLLYNILGNYYSLRSQHEKAVLYFQRALKISPTYLCAWTLMGHEYMELKNTSAAIQAYRQAVGKCTDRCYVFSHSLFSDCFPRYFISFSFLNSINPFNGE